MEIDKITPRPEPASPVEPKPSAWSGMARKISPDALAVIPLRLFLGLSFLAAGYDKIADPQFLNPTAAGYIGNQLKGFAEFSPLGGLLTGLAIPNASLFGGLILLGELAIGLGTLVGLLGRAAAFFGFALSLTLWLTASWQTTPFFLGSDLPYAFGWLTLVIVTSPWPFSLDAWIKQRREAAAYQPLPEEPPAPTFRPGQGPAVATQAAPVPTTPVNLYPAYENPGLARRHFILALGGTMVAGAVTGLAWMKTLEDQNEGKGSANGNVSLTLPAAGSTPGPDGPAQPAATAAATPGSTTQAPPAVPAATSTPAATSAPASSATRAPAATPTGSAASLPKGVVLGNLSALPQGSATNFTTPDTREPAILIRQADGSVKAFSSICTHEGCDVSYDKNSQVLVCPCHGAQFSAQTGEALRRPARRPLKSFAVSVADGKIIYQSA